MTKAAEKAARVLEGKREAFARKVRSLTGHVFGRVDHAAMRAAFEAGETADAYAAQVAAREPVGAAIHPQKAEAVAYAEQEALKTVEGVRSDLEAAGWNQTEYAPYPKGNRWSNPRHDAEMSRYRLVGSLTTADPSKGYQSYGTSGPYIVVMDDAGIERFVDNARRDAALNYDAFICKMVAKVGEGVAAAELTGSHIWAHSFLHVTKADGSRETWKTQQIVNYSVYGRPYLQWPSRKVKGGGR